MVSLLLPLHANKTFLLQVQTWFTNVIADDDVLKSTKIDIDVPAKIVAQSGATIVSFETFFAKNEHHEKTLIDIGVLRFPDIDRPYFKLYRIKLVAWSDSSRILFHQEDKNGITGGEHSQPILRVEVIACANRLLSFRVQRPQVPAP